MDRLSMMNARGKQVSSPDSALASDLFDKFCNATTMKTILGYHRQLCDVTNLKPNHINAFYPKLKHIVSSWRAKALWKKFDVRASHKCYARGKACPNTRVLIVGAGPCGLRTAIEAQLLGAKVVVVEKRDRMSRNNVLHLWPFVIEDLRALGAKKFFGKFCAGAIDHISIRQLQCILLKVALLLGVEVHTEVSFVKLNPPPSKEESEERIGWRGVFTPSDHPVSQYEFDVLIGADGRRNTLEGFKRKEFRGRLAIAITANFINKRTEAEARVEEISGVAFIFNQKFFKDLYEETGIDLENIVYYKDDTHYFVMTAKKQSLLDKGVILNDIADTYKLLGRENVDVEALQNYAREAADFSTLYQMPDLEFAVNHYGNPDVNMFDFTSMYAAENASKVLERNGHRLMMSLVGDSLLEPFWPTGSGCARGFLSSMDACWAIRGWGSGTMTPLEVLAERESIYRLLGQTTPENLQRDSKSYTLDPSTRYPNLNKSSLLPVQVTSLYDTDDPTSIQAMITAPPVAITGVQELHKKRRRRDSQVHPDTLLQWLKRQIVNYDDLSVDDLTLSFRDGLVLCAIIHRYRPDLLDFHALNKDDFAHNNQLAFDILEKELGIPPVMTGQEMEDCPIPDLLTMLSYLTQIYDTFRGEIPHIKHPKLDLPEVKKIERPVPVRAFHVVPKSSIATSLAAPPRTSARHRRHMELPGQLNVNLSTAERKARKRRSVDKVGATLEERQKRLEDIVANRNERMSRRKQQRKKQTEQFIKSMQMLHANAKFEEGVPFEDYSIYLYRQTAPNFEDRVKDLEKKLLCPDRDLKFPGGPLRGEKDEDFSGRIKDFEDKLREQAPQEKKPKDLLRAIGKIETTDWNVKEIEKKINENKQGKVNKEKERVPKWSSEQFQARRTKMEKRGFDRQDSEDKKYAAIDKSLKQLDQKLKEGTMRDVKQNKVSAITEQFKKQPEPESKPIQKSNSKIIVPAPGGSENCHFCSKRVYLMERLSAEGRFFHRGCFRCQYCSTMLRLGSYTFDRDGKYGHKFYCSQHFGMSGQLKGNKVVGKSPSRNIRDVRTPDKLSGIRDVTGVDLIDRVATPERVEFSNISQGISDHEESFSQMDEDEWTDRNFGASTAEIGSSDEDSSESDSESDDDEVFEEALDEPVTKEGTHRLAKEWVKRYSKDRELDDDSASGEDFDTGSDFSYENSSDEDESDTATEGEEEIRARELRKQEVRVKQPIVQTDTGSDTEVKNFSLILPLEPCEQILNEQNELFLTPEPIDNSTPPFGEDVPNILNKNDPDPSVNTENSIPQNDNCNNDTQNTLPDIVSDSQSCKENGVENFTVQNGTEQNCPVDNNTIVDNIVNDSNVDLDNKNNSASPNSSPNSAKKIASPHLPRKASITNSENVKQSPKSRRKNSNANLDKKISSPSPRRKNSRSNLDNKVGSPSPHRQNSQKANLDKKIESPNTGRKSSMSNSSSKTASPNAARKSSIASSGSKTSSPNTGRKSSIVSSDSPNSGRKSSISNSGRTTPSNVVNNNINSIKHFIKQKSFDQAAPTLYNKPDDQPLLIIKRTPSKINVPKEQTHLAKPRIASLASIEHARKFFGTDTVSKPLPKRPVVKRAERPKTTIGLVNFEPKKVEKEKPKIGGTQRPSFEFEPQDEDMKDLDKYIENLLAKEDELLIPVVAPKVEENTVNVQPDEEEKEIPDEPLTDSMEDLLKALEVETGVKDIEIEPEEVKTEKIDDLLNWITELEHQPTDQKLYKSYSDVKYKNLERVLKSPERADAVVNRLPKDNITFFERRMSGLVRDYEEPTDVDTEFRAFKLAKSKTDVYCNVPRASVDLSGIKIDIKGKLSMFEKPDDKPPPPLKKLSKSQSMKATTNPAMTFANHKSYVKQLSNNSDDLSDDNLFCVKTFNNDVHAGQGDDNNMYFSAQVNCVQETITYDNFVPNEVPKPSSTGEVVDESVSTTVPATDDANNQGVSVEPHNDVNDTNKDNINIKSETVKTEVNTDGYTNTKDTNTTYESNKTEDNATNIDKHDIPTNVGSEKAELELPINITEENKPGTPLPIVESKTDLESADNKEENNTERELNKIETTEDKTIPKEESTENDKCVKLIVEDIIKDSTKTDVNLDSKSDVQESLKEETKTLEIDNVNTRASKSPEKQVVKEIRKSSSPEKPKDTKIQNEQTVNKPTSSITNIQVNGTDIASEIIDTVPSLENTIKPEPLYATVNKELKKNRRPEINTTDAPPVPQRAKKLSPLPSTSEYLNGFDDKSETKESLSPPIETARSRDVSPTRAKLHDMKMNFLQSSVTKSESNLLQSVEDNCGAAGNSDTNISEPIVQPKIPSRKKSNNSAPSPVLVRKVDDKIELRPELPPRKRTSSYAIRQHGSKELNDSIRAANNEVSKKEEKKIAKAHRHKDKDCIIQ